jgi:energy-converting hydrogenase Eha subunit G
MLNNLDKFIGGIAVGVVIGFVCLWDILFQSHELRSLYQNKTTSKWKRPKRRPL